MRIETRHAPKPSQPEVVLSDGKSSKNKSYNNFKTIEYKLPNILYKNPFPFSKLKSVPFAFNFCKSIDVHLCTNLAHDTLECLEYKCCIINYIFILQLNLQKTHSLFSQTLFCRVVKRSALKH